MNPPIYLEEGCMLYSKTVMEHFRNPRNVGVIEDADLADAVGIFDHTDIPGVAKMIHHCLTVEHEEFLRLKWNE